MMFVCFWSQRLNTHFLFFFKGKLFDFLFFFCHPIHRMVLNHRRVDLRGIGKELKTLVQSWMGRKQSNHLNRESELVMRFPCVGLKYKSITTFFLFSEFETVNLKKKNITSSVYCWVFLFFLFACRNKSGSHWKKKIDTWKGVRREFFFFFSRKDFLLLLCGGKNAVYVTGGKCVHKRALSPHPPIEFKKRRQQLCVCVYQ